MKLNEELRAVACAMEPDQFMELLVMQLRDLYPDWTDEELQCRPDDAKRFCNMIRVKCEANVSDYVILRALTNKRKRSVKE